MDDNYVVKVDRSNAGCVGFIAFLILVAFGIWVIVGYVGERRLMSDLDTQGLRQTGVIESHLISSGNRNYLEVRYDAAPKLKDFKVAQDDFTRLKDGDKVTVRYMASDPYKAKLEGVTMVTQPASTLGVGIGLIAFGTLLFAGLAIWGSKGPAVDL